MTDTHLLGLCGEGFEQLISLQTLNLRQCTALVALPEGKPLLLCENDPTPLLARAALLCILGILSSHCVILIYNALTPYPPPACAALLCILGMLSSHCVILMPYPAPVRAALLFIIVLFSHF